MAKNEISMGAAMKNIRFLWIALLLLLPHILVIAFDPASSRSMYNFVSDVCGTIFFFDLPVGMCLLHYYFPQLFRHRKRGHYLGVFSSFSAGALLRWECFLIHSLAGIRRMDFLSFVLIFSAGRISGSQ